MLSQDISGSLTSRPCFWGTDGAWGGEGGALGGAVTCILNGSIFSLSPDLTCLLTRFPLLLHFGSQTSAWDDTSDQNLPSLNLDLALMSAQIQASAKDRINPRLNLLETG